MTMLSLFNGVITLDKATHLYAIDGVIAEKQVSVSSLANAGNKIVANEWLNNKAQYGTAVHAEIETYLNSPLGVEFFEYPETSAILSNLNLSVPNLKNMEVYTSIALGAIYVDKDTFVFGTPDLVLFNEQENYTVVEFKTGEFIREHHHTQTLLYKYILAHGIAVNDGITVAEALAKIKTLVINPKGYEYTEFDDTQIPELFMRKFEEYYTDDSAIVIEKDETAESLYKEIEDTKKKLKDLESRFKDIMDKRVPQQPGRYDFGCLAINRITFDVTSIDRSLVETKCPEAIIVKTQQRTNIKFKEAM